MRPLSFEIEYREKDNEPQQDIFEVSVCCPRLSFTFSRGTLFSVDTVCPLFQSFIVVVYLGFYGLGALLIREIVEIRKLSYTSVLLFGAAYGILEEGIILKSWFDPTWGGAAITAQVLRVDGISILQPLENVVYHAIISITTPILFVKTTT